MLKCNTTKFNCLLLVVISIVRYLFLNSVKLIWAQWVLDQKT